MMSSVGRLVHVVADYGVGDLAFSEVVQRLQLALPGSVVQVTHVPMLDTLSAGFAVAQLALTDGPPDRIVVHNVAPRRDEPAGRPANEGERFCGGRTRQGVLVAGPNAGWSWSFLRGEVHPLCYLDVPAGGSQFRSRDFLPKAVAHLAHGHPHAVSGRVPDALVPPVPESVIAYVDGYGNLKTTITRAPADPREHVVVRLNNVIATAVVSDGTFAVPEGELALAPGSTGWETHEGRVQRFYELFLRGGSAAALFHDPSAGTPVSVEVRGSTQG
jgi:hypothetical protein